MIQQTPSGPTLTDSAFLDDYLIFGLWQPVFMAKWLLRQAESTVRIRPTLALQIFFNMGLALEALAQWFFALRDWKPAVEPLLWKFKETRIIESSTASDYTTQRALAELERLDDEQVLNLLNQPPSDGLLKRGWSNEEVAERTDAIASVLMTLQAGFQNRAREGRVMMRGYNSLKHGLLAFRQFSRPSEMPTVFMLSKVEKGDDGANAVELLGLRCDMQEMTSLSEVTTATSKLIALLLCLLPWYYFTDLSWRQYRGQKDCVVNNVEAVWGKMDDVRGD